jgi:hypothetical protein
MARGKRIEDKAAALAAELDVLDGHLAEPAAEIAEVARSKRVPEVWLDSRAEKHFSAHFNAWAEARRGMADLVDAVGRKVDAAMAPLEDKPPPTRIERLRLAVKGLISTPWGDSRPRQVGSLNQALLLSNTLHEMLLPRRERILAMRHAVESDLVELTGHRPLLVPAIIEAVEEPGPAAVQLEQCLQAVQDLVSHLNRQVLEMNVALNKLMIDTERAIVLATVLAESGPATPGVSNPSAELLPQLASLIALNEAGMLSSKDLERRRKRVDSRFAEVFGRDADEASGRDPVPIPGRQKEPLG